jgi:hypothetical protein
MTVGRFWQIAIAGCVVFWLAVIVGVVHAFAGADIYGPIPLQFDHTSVRKMIVATVAPDNPVLTRCGAGVAGRIVSCAMLGLNGPVCLVYIAGGLTPTQRARALRHERANCNGWNDGIKRR